jgi:hypothetical protein
VAADVSAVVAARTASATIALVPHRRITVGCAVTNEFNMPRPD